MVGKLQTPLPKKRNTQIASRAKYLRNLQHKQVPWFPDAATHNKKWFPTCFPLKMRMFEGFDATFPQQETPKKPTWLHRRDTVSIQFTSGRSSSGEHSYMGTKQNGTIELIDKTQKYS